MEATIYFILLSSTVLAQQTVQEQTTLKHERGSLMEFMLPAKYFRQLKEAKEQNGWGKVSLVRGMQQVKKKKKT